MGEGNMKDQEPLSTPLKRGKRNWKWFLIGTVIIILAALVLYRGWGFTQKRSGTQRAARMEIPVQITPAVQ